MHIGSSIIVPSPRIDEQTAIVQILKIHDTLIQTKEERLAKLRQVKQGLMRDLLTGRLRV